jgi:Protein of unknown function (DUF3618)
MGQDPGKGGMVTADELRADIARKREELGETAAALGAKADVKGRAKERVNEIKEDPPVPGIAAAALVAGCAILLIVARSGPPTATTARERPGQLPSRSQRSGQVI